jgi:hypothetical protein
MIAGANFAGITSSGMTIAGASWEWWLGFHAVIAAVLLADSLMPGHRRESPHAQSSAI